MHAVYINIPCIPQLYHLGTGWVDPVRAGRTRRDQNSCVECKHACGQWGRWTLADCYAIMIHWSTNYIHNHGTFNICRPSDRGPSTSWLRRPSTRVCPLRLLRLQRQLLPLQPQRFHLQVMGLMPGTRQGMPIRERERERVCLPTRRRRKLPSVWSQENLFCE